MLTYLILLNNKKKNNQIIEVKLMYTLHQSYEDMHHIWIIKRVLEFITK